MKSIVVSIFLILSSVTALASEKYCKKESELINYYFLNGVGNSDKTIAESLNDLSKKIKIPTVSSLRNYKNQGSENELFPGWFTSFPIPTYGEVKETFEQKQQEFLKEKGTIVDLQSVQRHYNTLSDNSHNVIYAHSQGNLYANSLCKFNNNRKKQINIGIASPADHIECGSNYVTLKNDFIINALRIKAATDSTINTPLPGNASLKGLERCTDFPSFCHSLTGIYLNKSQPLAMIRSFTKDIQEKIKTEELDFNFINLTLKETKQEDKNVLLSSYERLNEFKSSTEMTIRRGVASVKALSYLGNVTNSSFIKNLTQLSFGKLSKKDLNALLDTPLEVESDQEYADLVGLTFDNLKKYCNEYPKLLPQNVKNYCQTTKDYYYYESKDFKDSNKFDSYSLSSNKFKWKNETKSLSLNCLDVQNKEDLSQEVVLQYTPEYGRIVSLAVNDLSYDIYPKNLLNKTKETRTIASIKVHYDEVKSVYTYGLTQTENKINFVTTNEESKEYLRCNSINKLLSNNCKDYFLTLLSRSK